MAQQSFTAQIDGWVARTKQRTTAVFRTAAQDVRSEMQKPVGAGGNMPIETGFLRSSLQVGINTEPAPASRDNPGGVHAYNETAADLTIAGADIGDVITMSYSAKYAPHVEYGARGRAPRRFVGLAAAQWQRIVTNATIKAKNTVLNGFARLTLR